jgi:uncharacterized protein
MHACFHLAFPCHDFDLAKRFYHDLLGFKLGRESKNALIIQFGQHQLVAHKTKTPQSDQQGIYPRHFGLIYDTKKKYDTLIDLVIEKKIDFYIEPKIRFEKTRIEHHSFFIKDPSNNLLEFKYYTHEDAIFGEHDFHKVGDEPD